MSIGRKILGGASWSFLGNIGTQVTNFVVFMVLARLLSVADFGLFGMVLVVMSFVGVISELGFQNALVQREDVKDSDWSTLFWFSLLFSLVIAAMTIGLSWPVSWFYEDPRVQPLLAAMSIQFVLSSLCSTHQAILSREMDFKYLSKMNIVSELCSGAVAIGFALGGLGIWSLIVKAMMFYIIRGVMLWGKGFWQPRWVFDINMLRDNARYSFGFFSSNFIHMWSRQADNLFIGRALGSEALGFYTRAYTTMLMPLRQTQTVASKVMFSGLSRLQHDPEQVRETYLKGLSIVVLIGFPSLFGLNVVAHDFLVAFYGDKWLGALYTLQLLCLAGSMEMLTHSTRWLFLSMGRADWLARWTLFTGLILTGGFGLGVWLGSIDYLSFIYACLSCLIFPLPAFLLVKRLIDLTISEVVRRVGPLILCSGAMAGAVWCVGNLILPMDWSHWLRLLIQVVVGAIVYIGLIVGLRMRVYVEARAYLKLRRAEKAQAST